MICSTHHTSVALFFLFLIRILLTSDAFTSSNVLSRIPTQEQQRRRPSFLPSLPREKESYPVPRSSDNNNISQQLIDIGQQTFAHYFTFPLDDWQLEAGGAICKGYNVILSAPTGAGKTAVGEMALLYAYHNVQQNGIYTTPLKALSNQKYSELCQTFGRTDTGLSTGDVSINKGARITVMTTEVYRNIAWRSSTPTATIMGTNELTSNAVVVLDEFHYMGHPGRGGVWEESIITSPSHTQIICLSATLSNAQALAAWMEYVTNRQTILVEVPNQKRPVPLRYLFATKEGLFPLFRDPDAGPGAPKGLLGYRGEGTPPSEEKKGTRKGFQGKAEAKKPKEKLPRGLQVNPSLRAAAEKRLQKVNRSIERQKVRTHLRLEEIEDEWGGRSSRRAPQGPRRMSNREERKERERLLRNEMRRAVPSLSALVNRLNQKELLPAIFFIFSRAGCDQAARSVFQVMKGPRDPNRLLQDEVEDFGGSDGPRQGKKRKTRQRGRQQGNLLEDSDGRIFRPSSSYISEDVLTSLMEAAEPMDEDEFDEISPLSSDNWDFYTKAGLLNYTEVRELASRISVFNDENPEIAFDDEIVEQYMYGVGSHHAGMLPAHKSFVEILYKLQLMKVVFATETLAAGINMPARTTVICALAKRGDGSSINLLETSNLLQMAGRAGRRGMDIEGTCVIVATPFESSDDASKILTDPIKPITSQFSPSYSLAINLIARGEGKLDVARQLVSKSFAMWVKTQAEENIAAAVENHGGEAVSEVLQASAEERFMNTLVNVLQDQVDRRRAKFNISRLDSLLGVLTDRESLKKTSKSYLGATKMLELEQTTLGYLETELATMRALSSIEEQGDEMNDMIKEDEKDLLDQIEIQRKRTVKTEKEVSKHPFSAIASIANEIMAEDSPEATVLHNALKSAREGEKDIDSLQLQAAELSKYSKSVVVVRRKTRKLANANPDLDPDALLKQADKANIIRDDSWEDMLSITKVLVAYGCLSMDGPVNDKTDYESQVYTVTPAGVNIGMLGFENSLWALVSMGGAWDVIGASSKLDRFRKAMSSFEEDIDWYDDEDEVESIEEMPKAQQEAEDLVSLLRSMTPSELAGYVSSIVAEGSRGSGPSVVDLFQQLTPLQQKVVQTSLLVMERLMEVQKEYSTDESTRNCVLDISNTQVVTAWAAGCSWSEALQIAGTPAGDLARTLSRVLDSVRQLGKLPYEPIRRRHDVVSVSPGIHPEIRRLCRQAAQAINRYPVKDPLAFETPIEDDEEEEIVPDDEFENDSEKLSKDD